MEWIVETRGFLIGQLNKYVRFEIILKFKLENLRIIKTVKSYQIKFYNTG